MSFLSDRTRGILGAFIVLLGAFLSACGSDGGDGGTPVNNPICLNCSGLGGNARLNCESQSHF